MSAIHCTENCKNGGVFSPFLLERLSGHIAVEVNKHSSCQQVCIDRTEKNIYINEAPSESLDQFGNKTVIFYNNSKKTKARTNWPCGRKGQSLVAVRCCLLFVIVLI